MKISELGEFGLIDLIAGITGVGQKETAAANIGGPRLVIDIGDDTAAWQLGQETELATTDTLVQDVHFSFKYATWRELGWKALAVNLSDIAAMGGYPKFALVTLGLPKDIEVEAILEFYRGMIDAGAGSGVQIVGGDMVSAPLVFLTVALTGIAGTGPNGQTELLLRSQARPGDKIAVTDELGSSAAGLKMLLSRLSFDSVTSNYLRKSHLTPVPRLVEGRILVGAGIKTCMDISDGLVIDLQKICQASGVGATINVDKLPVSNIARQLFPDTYIDMALSGGEDYELLFTGTDGQIENIRQKTETPITVVGEITADQSHSITLVDEQGKVHQLAKTGWDHFSP